MADPVPSERDQWMAAKVACVSGDVKVRESLMKAAALAISQARAEGAAAAHKAWNIEAGRICAGSEFIADPKRVFDHIMDHTLPMERGLGKQAGEAAAAERIAELESIMERVEEWWANRGRYAFYGAPESIFALRAALAQKGGA